ncbi:MAG: ornithine carbamoyltransferase [Propionibacteriaceae bacterium]|jgi:ornithine carbamoyltransferase|nr:ornithine carbamoyltransferase [Propionibacteriaceae bacterium]
MLKGRDYLKEVDFTPAEWRELIALTGKLKKAKKNGTEVQRLTGKNLVLLFEKTSTRTRSAFEVAAYDQGAHVTTVTSNSQMGLKESIADSARVFSRMYDGIEYRGFGQTIVETLAEYSDVPVYNGLTDEWHPTQSLCDSFTMEESAGRPASELSYAYVGDARFNTGCSLLVAGALLGADVRIVSPEALRPPRAVVEAADKIALETGARLTLSSELDAVEGCDFLHTDVWVSMGEPAEVWAERIELLRGYQVNAELMRRTGKPDVKFMHCLPAYHDRNTEIGEKVFQEFGIAELEVSDEVFEGPASIVFDQAENRMHSIKAVLVATLA